MAKVPMTQKDSIVDQLEELHQRIAVRTICFWVATAGATPSATG